MNKIYRTIWNHATQSLVVVSELAKSNRKSSVNGGAEVNSASVASKTFTFSALMSAILLSITGTPVSAAPGIYINDGNDGGCTATYDQGRNTGFFSIEGSNGTIAAAITANKNITPNITNDAANTSTQSVNPSSFGLASSYNPCLPTGAATQAHDTQTNRTLFYNTWQAGNAGNTTTHNGANSLTLGGRLDVNSGIIGVGDRGVNGGAATNSIRMGSGSALDDRNKVQNAITIGASTKNDAGASGSHTIAIGSNATAKNLNGLAIGRDVISSGDGAIVIGSPTSATRSAQAIGGNALAIGSGAQANGGITIAIGENATADRAWDISIGRQAGSGQTTTQTEGRNIAIGDGALRQAVNPSNNIAMGTGAAELADGTANVTIGTYANSNTINIINNTATPVTASNVVAIGDRALASAGSAVAIGNRTKATGNISIALGGSAVASANYAIAQGYAAQATGISSIAIGGAQNVPNQTRATSTYATAIGFAANAGAEGAIAIGRHANHDPTKQAADRAKTTGKNSIALGTDTHAEFENALAIGTGAQAKAKNAISIGVGNVVSGEKSGALGDPSYISGTGTYTIGNDNGTATAPIAANNAGAFGNSNLMNSTAAGSRIVGNSNNIQSANVMVMGNNVTVGANLAGAVVLGNASTVSAATKVNSAQVNGVTYSGFAGNSPNAGDIVSVGSTTAPRQIQNVAAGQITATSTDAINGSQLHATQTAIGNLASSTAAHFGGNAAVLADGKISAPTYTINGNTYNNVGAALAAATTHYYSVNSTKTASGDNYNNEGATGQNALAAGVTTKATATDAVAIGSTATASGNQSLAVGNNIEASHLGATAVGNNSRALADGAQAFGQSSQATAKDSAAMGRYARTTAERATAVGVGNMASGVSSFAGGDKSTAAGAQSIAIGLSANAAADDTVAVGKSATSQNKESIAIGSNANTGTAVNSNQTGLNVAIGTNATNKDTSWESTAVGADTLTQGVRTTAVGYGAQALQYYATALGYKSKATEWHSLAIGSEANVAAVATTDVANAQAITTNLTNVSDASKSATAIAIGRTATAAGYAAIAQGVNTKATTAYATAIGANANAEKVGATSFGAYASAQADSSIALGRYSHADREKLAGTTTYGADPLGAGENKTGLAWQSNAGALSIGSSASRNQAGFDVPATTRQIINVAAGSQDTDAVNVAQLKAAGFKLAATNVGGGESTTVADDKIQNGETVTVDAGKNIKVTHTANKVSIATKDEVNFTKVTIGDTAGNNTVLTSTADGLDVGGDKITNVASGGTTDSNAANIGDVKKAANAAKTEVTGSGLAKVTKTTGNANQDIYNVDVATAAAPTVTRGNVSIATGDEGKVMTAGDVAKAINGSERTSSVVAGSSNKLTVQAGSEDTNGNTQYTVDLSTATVGDIQKGVDAKSAVDKGINFGGTTGSNKYALGDTINVKGDSNISSTTTNDGVQLKLANVVTIGEATTPGQTVKPVKIDGTTGTITGLTNTTWNGPNNITSGRAATEDQLAILANTIGGVNSYSGWKLTTSESAGKVSGTTTEDINQAETVTIDAGKNIAITQATNKITIATAENAAFTSVTAGNSKLDNSGLTITGGPSVTTTGINAGNKQITNVASGGTTGTNAANIDDVKKAAAAAKTEVKAGTNVTSVVKTQGTDGHDIYTVNADGASVSAASGSAVAVTKGTKNTSTNVTDYAVDLTQATKDNINKGVAAKTAVDTQGLTFTGDSGTTGVKKLGSSVAVTGDSNITTAATTAGVQVKLNSNLNVTSVTTGPVSLSATGLNNGGQKISNVAAGTANTDAVNVKQLNDAVSNINNSAANSGWNLQGNGAQKDLVKSSDAVNFVNGTGTTATVTTAADGKSSTIAYSVNTTTLTTGTDGKVTSGAPGNTFATATQVADAINKAGFTLTVAATGTGEIAGKTNELINSGDTMTVEAGNNIKVTQANGKVTVATKDNVTFNSVTAGGNTLNSNGLSISGGPSVTKSGIDAGNKTITNVAKGVNDSDAVNVAQLKAVESKAKNSVQSVTSVDPNLTATRDAAGNVTLDFSDTPTFNKTTVGSVVTDGTTNKISGLEKGDVNATSKDAINGSQLFAQGEGVKNIIGGTTTYDPATGTYTNNNIGGTGASNINDAIQSVRNTAGAGWNLSAQGANKTNVAPNATVDLNNTDGNIVISKTTANNDVTFNLAKDLNVDTVKANSFTAGNTTINNDGLTIANADPTKVVSLTSGGLNNGGNKVVNVAAGTADTDAANVGQLKGATTALGGGAGINADGTFKAPTYTTTTTNGTTLTANNVGDALTNLNNEVVKPLSFAADVGTNVERKLGSTVSVNGDSKNITTSTTADGVKVALNNTINVSGVIADGVSIKGNGPTLTKDGMNMAGQPIINMANGLPTKIDANGNVVPMTTVEIKQAIIDGTLDASVLNKAVNVGDLVEQGNNVLNVSKNIYGADGDGNPYVRADGTISSAGRAALRTYNVDDNGTLEHNGIFEAIKNMNEQGIKFFHTNDGVVNSPSDGYSEEDSNANAAYSTAIGYKALASKNAVAGLAIGPASVADSAYSVALGAESVAQEAHVADVASGSAYTYGGLNDDNVAAKATKATRVASIGAEGKERQLQHVAAGVISPTSTDAVNGSQLYYTNKAVENNTRAINQLRGDVHRMDRKLRAGIAGATATAGLPQAYTPGKSMVAAAAGTYSGESALALGVSRISDNGKVVIKLTGNANTRGDYGATIGAGYQW